MKIANTQGCLASRCSLAKDGTVFEAPAPRRQRDVQKYSYESIFIPTRKVIGVWSPELFWEPFPLKGRNENVTNKIKQN